MSDEALNKHLDWLDECDKARAKSEANEGYWWQCPYCGEFMPDAEYCTCDPENDDIPF